MVNLEQMGKEYSLSHLEETDLDPNPFKQFENWLQDATESGITEANAMSLATVDSNGEVSVRMMLCKSFSPEGFSFFTNYNSKKAQSLLNHPQAAIQFWWPPLERQVRIEGIAHKMDSLESDHYFAKRAHNTQLAATLSKQSQAMPDKQAFLDEYAALSEKLSEEDAPLKRPDYWGGFILKPTQFEFWQGGLHRLHDRLCYKLLNTNPTQWKIIRLYP